MSVLVKTRVVIGQVLLSFSLVASAVGVLDPKKAVFYWALFPQS
jgi:hypothetical protein